MDILQENQCLKRIQALSPELIRIIYEYMSGNAKWKCNKKLDTLFSKVNIRLQEKLYSLTKKQILDFIFIGPIRNHSEIVSMIRYCSYYSSITYTHGMVKGYHLLQLWESDRLKYDFISSTYVRSPNIDMEMKYLVSRAVYRYIQRKIAHFRKKKQKQDLNLNLYLNSDSDRDTLLEIDRIFYLYSAIRFLSSSSSF